MVVILHEAGMRSRAADLYRRRAPEAENGLAGELAVDFAASVPGSSRNHNPRRTVEFVLILFVPRITEFVYQLIAIVLRVQARWKSSRSQVKRLRLSIHRQDLRRAGRIGTTLSVGPTGQPPGRRVRLN